MIMYSGWVVIREAYLEDEEDVGLLNDIIKRISQKIDSLDRHNEFIDLRPLNGCYHLTLQGNHNHRNNDLIEFFIWVAKISPGSFGILYIQDDEDSLRGNEQNFKVWRMKKGQVDELDDPFLSPVYPTIEE